MPTCALQSQIMIRFSEDGLATAPLEIGRERGKIQVLRDRVVESWSMRVEWSAWRNGQAKRKDLGFLEQRSSVAGN